MISLVRKKSLMSTVTFFIIFSFILDPLIPSFLSASPAYAETPPGSTQQGENLPSGGGGATSVEPVQPIQPVQPIEPIEPLTQPTSTTPPSDTTVSKDQSTSTSQATPPATLAPSQSNSDKPEKVEKYTSSSKHTKNPNGTNTARIYTGDMFQKDAKGSWQQIDNNLEETNEKPGFGYKNRHNKFNAYFAEETTDSNLVGFKIAASLLVRVGSSVCRLHSASNG